MVWPGAMRPKSRALVADGLEVHACAVVDEADHDFRAFAMQLEDDLARFRFAGSGTRNRLFDAVYDGVAEHVLERRQHALQHLTVEFAGGALHYQLGFLACVGRGLANDTRQTLNVTLERNHAGTHEAVLQLGDRAGLLLQEVLGFFAQVFEQLLNAADVVRRFSERAGELLDRRIAVELQRIEVAAVSGFVLVTVQDLRLGFDFEVTQLLLQAGHGA